MGTVNVKVCESDFVPLWKGTIIRRSFAECNLLEVRKSEVMNLGKEVQSFVDKHQYLISSDW